MPNTGYKGYSNLEEYNTGTGTATGPTKPNVTSDPDYVEPVYDTGYCPLPPNNAPGIPGSFNAVQSGNSIVLTWTKPTDSDGTVIGYRIQRTDNGGVPIDDDFTIGDVTTYTDSTSLTNGLLYSYTLRAIDNDGAQSTGTNDSVLYSAAAFSISPIFYSTGFGASSFNITISNTTGGWTSNDSSTWISRTPTSNGSDSTISVNLQSNVGGAFRSGWVDITSNGVTKTCNIEQDGEGGGCLVENTKITYFDGSIKLIQDLVVGDEILSPEIVGFRDTNNVNELYKSKIANMSFENIKAKIIKIEPIQKEMVIQLNNGLLSASKEHSQLIKRGDIYIFTPLENVLLEDYLVDVDGNEVLITEIEEVFGGVTVYKLTLEGPTHTFYANGIITHNVKQQ